MIPWYSAQDSCSRLQGFLFFFGGRVAQSRDTNETCECAGKKSDEHFVTMEFGRKIWVVGLTLTKTVVFFFQFLCNRQWVSWPRTDGFFRGNGRRWIRRAVDVSHGLPNFSGMIHQDFFLVRWKPVVIRKFGWVLQEVPGSLPRCAATNPNCY